MLHDFSTDSARLSVAAAKYYLLAATLSTPPPDADTRNRDARDLLSAAKEAYDWWHACWEIGIRGNPEELCAADRVSRDQREGLAAAKEHLLRMERLLAEVQAKSPPPIPVAAASFYVAEAKNLHRRLLRDFSP